MAGIEGGGGQGPDTGSATTVAAQKGFLTFHFLSHVSPFSWSILSSFHSLPFSSPLLSSSYTFFFSSPLFFSPCLPSFLPPSTFPFMVATQIEQVHALAQHWKKEHMSGPCRPNMEDPENKLSGEESGGWDTPPNTTQAKLMLKKVMSRPVSESHIQQTRRGLEEGIHQYSIPIIHCNL